VNAARGRPNQEVIMKIKANVKAGGIVMSD
jgi:hypothetical protein